LQTHIRFVSIDEEGNPIPIGEKGKNRITRLIESIQPKTEQDVQSNPKRS